MKKFLFHSIIFLLPFMVLFSLPFGVLLKTGELVSIPHVIALQENTEKLILFGRVYTDSHYDRDYKIESTLIRKPKVLLMGSSRVLGYRSVFFKDKEVFYNAGRSIARTEDLNYFLNKIPETQTPQVIIVSLDQDLFFHKFQEDPFFKTGENTFSLFFKHNWRLLYSDYVHKKFTLTDVLKEQSNMEAIGLNAVVHHKGFRNDGSYYYGDIINGNSETEARRLELNEQGVSAITPVSCLSNYYGETIRPEAITELKNFLEMSRRRNIAIIGFISPYSPGVYDRIQGFRDHCSLAAKELDRVVMSAFNETGTQFVDVSDLKKLGSSDSELFDAGHYSEKLALRLFITLAEANPILKSYVDLSDLRERLKVSQDNFTVFSQP